MKKKRFQRTEESQQVVKEIEKAAQIKAMLINVSPKIDVIVKGDTAFVGNVNPDIKDSVEKRIKDLGCVANVNIQETLVEKPGYINPYYNI